MPATLCDSLLAPSLETLAPSSLVDYAKMQTLQALFGSSSPRYSLLVDTTLPKYHQTQSRYSMPDSPEVQPVRNEEMPVISNNDRNSNERDHNDEDCEHWPPVPRTNYDVWFWIWLAARIITVFILAILAIIKKDGDHLTRACLKGISRAFIISWTMDLISAQLGKRSPHAVVVLVLEILFATVGAAVIPLLEAKFP